MFFWYRYEALSARRSDVRWSRPLRYCHQMTGDAQYWPRSRSGMKKMVGCKHWLIQFLWCLKWLQSLVVPGADTMWMDLEVRRYAIWCLCGQGTLSHRLYLWRDLLWWWRDRTHASWCLVLVWFPGGLLSLCHWVPQSGLSRGSCCECRCSLAGGSWLGVLLDAIGLSNEEWGLRWVVVWSSCGSKLLWR